MTGSTLNSPGPLTNAAGATLSLRNSNTISADVVSAGLLTTSTPNSSRTNVIEGSLTNAASATVRISAGWGDSSTLRVTNGLANAGRIELTQADYMGAPALTVEGGPLVNEATGVIQTLAGVGSFGSRTLTAELDNRGTPQVDASLTINGSMTVDGSGILTGHPLSTFAVDGNLLGDTLNADRYAPLNTVRLDGSGTAAAPQLLEVMGRDDGNVAAGFRDNFAYRTLALANGAYVRLVDQSDNAAGNDGEALYADFLIVPAGTTLDLNGLHVYARATRIAGAIVGGTIELRPDSGPIYLNTPTPGSIAVVGETDEWTFFGRAGEGLAVTVNPGSGGSFASLPPYLDYVQVQLLDPANNLLATATSPDPGTVVTLRGIELPSDGIYRVQVKAPETQPNATGNYIVAVWDATVDIQPLLLNRQVMGHVETAYSVDHWTFSAAAGQQVRFDLVNMASPSIRFDLTGPGDWIGFSGLSADSGLVTLPTSGTHTLTAYVPGGGAGDVAMPAPLLTFQGPFRALLTLDESRIVPGLWTSAEPDGFYDSVQFLGSSEVGDLLQPGERRTATIYYAGLLARDLIVVFSLSTLTADDARPIDWDSLKEPARPEDVSPEAWEAVWANVVAQTGTTWGDYVTMLNENASYLARLGESVDDVRVLWNFEIRQADGLIPVGYLTDTTDVTVPAPGLSINFGRAYRSTLTGRFTLGPLGRGWYHGWQRSFRTESDRTVVVTEPGGFQRRFQPDVRGRYFSQPGDFGILTAQGGGAFHLVEPNGLLTRFGADGSLDYVEEPNGNRITADYNGDQLTGLTHSSGKTLQIAYNAAGRIERLADPIGRETVFSYDAADEHLISVTDPDGQTTYTYASGAGAQSQHALLSVEHSDGTHDYFSYDAWGRLATTSRDEGQELLTFTYNTTGSIDVSDALGNTTELFFDHRGLLLKAENPFDDAFHWRFDNNRNLTGIVGPTGKAYQFGYDPQSNLVRFANPLGGQVDFGYNGPFDRLTSVSDANGNPTGYAYDGRGNLNRIGYADDSLETFDYDTLGNPITWTNRRGDPIDFSHDASGRITAKVYPDGSQVDYTYDARGNLDSATDAAGTTTLDYDPEDRLTRITYPSGRFLEYSCDAAGRRTQMVDQDSFTVNYHYDQAGRLAGLTDRTAEIIVSYSYDPVGRLDRRDMGNGTYTTYEYDAVEQLLHLVNHAPDGSVNSRFDYTYDRLGRRTGMTTLDGQWTYQYDATGQLTRAVFQSVNAAVADQDLTYVYDPAGNRIRTIKGGVTTEYVSNNLNQYTTVGTAAHSYDVDGNLVSVVDGPESAVYTYDEENRLTRVVLPEGTWIYEYDPFGNRIASIQDGQRTEYLVDPFGLGDVVGEYDGSGDLIARYTHGLGLTSQVDTTGVAAYYDFDALGSTAGVSDLTGSYVNSYSYLPFGEDLSALKTLANPFEYVGQWGIMEEGNGLGYMRARYYVPTLGRFSTPDPLGILGGDANLYTYVRNDPIRFVDPMGWLSTESKELLVAMRHGGKKAAKKAAEKLPPEYARFRAGIPKPSGLAAGLAQTWTRVISPITSFADAAIQADKLAGQGNVLRGFENRSRGLRKEALGTESLIDEYTAPLPDKKSLNKKDANPVGPEDPNEKIGPGGFGEAGFLASDTLLSYRVNFENEQDATAPAQRVDVIDQLGPDLNRDTFELADLGFGDQLITVPAGSRYFRTEVDMTYNGQDFQVEIEAGLHSETGEVFAHFQAIDPTTSLPPEVLTGFLPPEDGTGRGMGYVSYTIRPKADLPTGTEIRNVALITFDRGETIATNQVDPHDPSQGTDPALEALNTIDAGVPASAVDPLPETVDTYPLTVTWTGQDDVGGSGVATYDVYVSVNGGEYQLWLADTDQSSAEFYGRGGNSYAFYTVATDNVGHEEEPPEVPDAQVTLVSRITGRHIFYNNSHWDTPTEEDPDDYFDFKVGNDNNPGNWVDAPEPSSITVRPDEGVDGSDRLTIIWADHAIQKQWMQVTVLGNSFTGLAEPDAFYFGNAIGESGNSTTDAKVNAFDMLGARDNQRNFLDSAPVDFSHDYNRDARVDATDMLIARNHQTHFLNALRLITVPGGKAAGEQAPAVGGWAAQDAVFKQAVEREPGRPEASSSKLDWLYEFEELSSNRRPAKNSNAVEETLDLPLAAPGL